MPVSCYIQSHLQDGTFETKQRSGTPCLLNWIKLEYMWNLIKKGKEKAWFEWWRVQKDVGIKDKFKVILLYCKIPREDKSQIYLWLCLYEMKEHQI